ncbi:MAG: hypothetical protein BRC23_01765 [Parcubacteria group bacterium SW_4_49_11]|jgi:hypothetical protein|nr:MAG: hypothetical protein BRC23_01765 [Parcubacteria group bacterium SW_4_49_11]
MGDIQNDKAIHVARSYITCFRHADSVTTSSALAALKDATRSPETRITLLRTLWKQHELSLKEFEHLKEAVQ